MAAVTFPTFISSANDKPAPIAQTHTLSNGKYSFSTKFSTKEVPLLKQENPPGMQIPTSGYGSKEKGWFVDPAENARIVTVLSQAIRLGLRLIDTAKVNATEELVGRAIRESDVPRDQITVITKLWNTDHHRVREAFEESLNKLMIGYIDIYIMHWPCALSNKTTQSSSNSEFSDHEDSLTGHPLPPDSSPTYIETYYCMETLLGPRCRSIGVSNFTRKTLTTLLSACTIKPVINQIEVHPLNPSLNLVSWCQQQNITVVAWGPLAGGPRSEYGKQFQLLYTSPTLLRLASKYHPPVTTTTTTAAHAHDTPQAQAQAQAQAQNLAVGMLMLSYLHTRGIIAIPHASSVERIVGNLKVVCLESPDVEAINALHLNADGWDVFGGVSRLVEGSPVWNERGPEGRGRCIFGWTVGELGFDE